MAMAMAMASSSSSEPEWLDKADNAWQMTAAAMVGLQSVPGLVILYGSVVKKKWAVNSAFMALYAFAATLLCWVSWAYRMAFGEKLLPIWGKAGPALSQIYLLRRASLPATAIASSASASSASSASSAAIPSVFPSFPMATMVFYQFAFAAITVIILAGSLLGRMNLTAWMLFVPLWLTLSYTVGAFCLWGGGFLFHWGVLDYSGGYVIHLSSGVAGLVAAFWVGPRMTKDRERFPPNNVLLTLAGAGLLWLGWSGFNGGSGFAADIDSSLAVLNTHICTATSLLVWTALDVLFFNKPSVIGAVQGMTTGLVCITPGAGLVQGWAAIVMGALSGSVPWFTMMVVHKKLKVLRRVDDTLAVFHTHAVAGLLGGILTGLFADPVLCGYFRSGEEGKQCGGSFYGRHYRDQIGKQLVGALFVAGWNLFMTSAVCLAIKLVVPLRMSVEELSIGDDAAHGEEAYALWYDDEEKLDQAPNDNFVPVSSFQQEADIPLARFGDSPQPNLPASSTVHL